MELSAKDFLAETEIYGALSITSEISSWLTISRTIDSYFSLVVNCIGRISAIDKLIIASTSLLTV